MLACSPCPCVPMAGPACGTRPTPRSDLPVGDAPAPLVAVVLCGARRRRAALAVTALGIGAAAGAIGTGLAEPLPPATQRRSGWHAGISAQ